MSMFDWFHIEGIEEPFQTKDFECDLLVYRLDKNGVLTRNKYCNEEPVFCPCTATIEIYGNAGEFIVYILDGRLIARMRQSDLLAVHCKSSEELETYYRNLSLTTEERQGRNASAMKLLADSLAEELYARINSPAALCKIKHFT